MEIRVQKLGRESGTGSGTGENPGQGRMAAGPEGASTLNMEPSTGKLGNRDKSLQAHPHCAELRPRSPPSSIHLPSLLTGATAAFKRRAVGASGRGEALRVDRACWSLAAHDAYRINLAANLWAPGPWETGGKPFLLGDWSWVPTCSAPTISSSWGRGM